MATTNPPAAPPGKAERAPELLDHLLKLPEQVRLDLANLLLDSVSQGFTSLAEAQTRDQQIIRQRVEAYERGELKAVDPEQVGDHVAG